MADAKSSEVISWLEKALQDLQATRRLLEGSFPLTDIASFHAQQAAEKAIKAYLTSHDIVFPKTHSLVALIALCLEINDEFNVLRRAAITLTPYAVASRYPGNVAKLSLEDAKTAYALAKDVWRFVLNELPHEIIEQFIRVMD
ncbi:HEPN domain-containing protein [Candidatus Leptofilum sp.]|uniref:HEPN domain-containing protein n=1 Tax=Candidatus Leptofilum sp. TaxID=3241576 RepID=UPI003B5996C4